MANKDCPQPIAFSDPPKLQVGSDPDSLVSLEERKGGSVKHPEYKEEDLLRDASEATISYNLNPPQIEMEKVAVPGAFVMRNVLTPEECKQLIDLAVALKFEPSPLRNLGSVNSTRFNMATEIRNSERVLLDAPTALADELNRRVQAHLPPVVECEGESWGLVTLGTGTARAPLNSRWRFGRYAKGGFFRPHYDAGFVYSATEKTLLTFILYLNEGFLGGETVFFPLAAAGDKTEVAVVPKTGSAIVFFQAGDLSPLHEGRMHTTDGGYKYILRSDVAYSLLPRERPVEQPKPTLCSVS